MTPFDTTGAYSPTKGQEDLRRQAIRGAGVTVLSSGLGLVIQIVATVGLARLLTPADFGLVTMVTTFSLLLVNFGLNGFTEAVLQREELDHYLVSNLFWINLSVGLLLSVAFAGAGSLLGKFYHNLLVGRVAVGMSLTILLTSLSVQHLALLRRAMRFSAVSANDILARLISLAVSFLLAWMGWGYWALVLGAIAQPLAQSIGAWILCRWIPGLPRRAPGTGEMVRFAVNVYGRFGLNYFSRNVDNLLVGWRLGPASLGFYKKAYDLFALTAGQLTSPLANVAVSALSRLNPRSAEYRDVLSRGISVLAFVGMGLSAAFTLLGTDLIRVLLGPGWEQTGKIFTFFGPGIGVMVVYYVHGWIHLSIGKADRWLKWGLIEAGVTFLLFILAVPWGAAGVALAWTLSFWILIIPAFWYAGEPIELGVGVIVAAIWRYVAASVLAGAACAVIRQSLPFVDGPLARIAITSVLLSLLYLLTVALLHGSRAPLYQIAELAREMIWGGRSWPSDSPAAAALGGFKGAPASSEMESRPLVSILIPAYNAQEWIADTLRSALAQTWEPKEVIVVDDGSTDQTFAIARQFESDWVRVVTQKNEGAAAARNAAYSLSHGDYIQWLDADDLLAPDKIAKQMEVVEQDCSKRTLLSSSFGLFKYRFYRAKFVPSPLWCDQFPVEWLILKLGQNCYMQTATWLVSRELTEAAGPWNTSLLGDDDGEYFCRVLMESDRVRFIPESKVFYRAPWVGTLSYIARSDKKLNAHWHSMQLHIRHLLSHDNGGRARTACLRYLEANQIYFYPDKSDIVAEVQSLARDLGKELDPPRLSWKYAWIVRPFGWQLAKYFQVQLPKLRWRIEKSWEKMLFVLEGRGVGYRDPLETAGAGKSTIVREGGYDAARLPR